VPSFPKPKYPLPGALPRQQPPGPRIGQGTVGAAHCERLAREKPPSIRTRFAEAACRQTGSGHPAAHDVALAVLALRRDVDGVAAGVSLRLARWRALDGPAGSALGLAALTGGRYGLPHRLI